MLHVQPHDMLTTEHNMASVTQYMNLLIRFHFIPEVQW